MTNGGGQKHGPKKGSKRATKKTAKSQSKKAWAEKAVQGAPPKN